MATLKSYICSKCAGFLMFESDQEFFDCPFCGNRYDIVDFHDGEVLDQAKACLKQKSFDTAKEKFDQVLDNDPQNFDALLGSVLCVLNLSSAERIEDRDNLSGRDLTEAKKALINAKRFSVGDKAEYFEEFITVIESYEKSVKLDKRKQELLSGDTIDELNQKMLNDLQTYRSDERWSHPWTFIILGVIMLFVMVVFLPMAIDDSAIGPMLARIVLFFVVFGAVILAVCRKDEIEDEKYKPADAYGRKLDNKIASARNNYNRAYTRMKKMYASIVSATDAPQETVESTPVSVTDIETEKNISCSKCGAKLILDKNKRVYQCDHCGVAYGVSLFFGLPMEKALNALNTGNYKDAGQRFSSLLMVDASDFEALLGKILCAGKWSTVSNIRLSADWEDQEAEAVRSCIEDAGQKAADNDKQFFTKMGELISFFGHYKENKAELDSLNQAVSDMETKADVYATAYAGANYDENYKKERQELVNKTFPAQVKQKKLEEDFAKIRKELIETRSGCRLVK